MWQRSIETCTNLKLLSKKLPETPFPENEKVVEGTDEERAAAAGLPYRELVGTLAYPSAYTRLDIRREVSERTEIPI